MFKSYRTQEKLDNHTKLCNENIDAQKAIYPNSKNKYIKFINYKNGLLSIFVFYADFEAINETNKITKHKTTEVLTRHNVCSYSYKLVCTIDDRFSKPVKLYRGENAAYKFIENMLLEEACCIEITNFNKPIIMT